MSENMLSNASTYGIQAMIVLAERHMTSPERIYIPVAEISGALGISHQFLKKIMQKLVENGLCISQRSAKGGVALAKAAKDISLFAIVSALDGAEFLTSECILKMPECNNKKPCPIHHLWVAHRVKLCQMFEETSIKFLADRVKEGVSFVGFLNVEMNTPAIHAI